MLRQMISTNAGVLEQEVSPSAETGTGPQWLELTSVLASAETSLPGIWQKFHLL